MESLSYILWTLVVSLPCIFFYLHYKANFWQRRRIPHLKPVLGIGNMAPLLFKSKNFMELVSESYNAFPEAKYFGMVDLHNPIAVLRDPDLIKETCVKNFEHFLDHQNFFDETVDPLFGKNVFSLKGERWKEMRNTLSPSFTATKMKFMFELIEKCASDFVQYFLEHPEMLSSVETKDIFTRYTCDVIATAAFGIGIDSMKDRDNEFYLKGKDATSLDKGLRAIKLLILRVFPSFMRLIGEPFLPRSSDRFFKRIVRETVKARKENKIVRPDMIHILMESRDKDNGVNLTTDDIVAQAFIFFFAGFDTVSTAMCFAAHELAVNPDIQEKLRQEVDTFTNNGEEKLTYDTISKMKYLDMVISETLRKYPPAPQIDRMCTKKFSLSKATPDSDEYIARPGSLIWIPVQGLHHDPKYFPDPDKFDPERFSDENKENIHPYTYLPFGVGPRKCIANRFALMETKILFVHILQKFIIERSEKTVHPVKFKKGFVMGAEGGSWVKFTKRNG